MPAAELTKLAGILGLLASDHDGEVVAAGRAATRHLQAAGITWNDLLLPSLPPRRLAARVPDWRELVAHCARQSGSLTRREADFIADLQHWREHHLSTRQLAWLERIAAKLRARGARR